MATLNDNARVTPSEVRSIFSTDLTDDALTRFINMAAEVVDDVTASAPDVSDQRLHLIEMNMAAHIATSDDPQPLQESVGSASFMYVRDRTVTEYLKTAADLDPSNVITVGRESEANIRIPDSR